MAGTLAQKSERAWQCPAVQLGNPRARAGELQRGALGARHPPTLGGAAEGSEAVASKYSPSRCISSRDWSEHPQGNAGYLHISSIAV